LIRDLLPEKTLALTVPPCAALVVLSLSKSAQRLAAANDLRTRLEEFMTFAKKMTLVLGLVATSFLASSAQEVNAHFTLKHPTSFGGRVLPAGSYQLQTVNRGTLLAFIRSTDENHEGMMTVPKSLDYTTGCAKSSLRMMSENGGWSATSVCFADSALTLYFSDEPREQPVKTAALQGSY
jgi:hypothetical protein